MNLALTITVAAAAARTRLMMLNLPSPCDVSLVIAHVHIECGSREYFRQTCTGGHSVACTTVRLAVLVVPMSRRLKG